MIACRTTGVRYRIGSDWHMAHGYEHNEKCDRNVSGVELYYYRGLICIAT